jgi:hypothetical protein
MDNWIVTHYFATDNFHVHLHWVSSVAFLNTAETKDSEIFGFTHDTT